MLLRTILILALGGALIWDFFSVGAMEATLTRASAAAIHATRDGAAWVQAKAHDFEVHNRLSRMSTAQDEAMREMLALERAELEITPSENFAILPAPHIAETTDFGDSVFSRAAINTFIGEASSLTGIPDHYLAHLAERESSFDPVAAAGTSSAKGLYQFTEATWLDLFARHGPNHGQGELARHIELPTNGRPTVENLRLKRRILNLRFDPKLSTFMAAHYAREQRVFLTRRLGREPNYAELYIAHFLGASGAAKLFIAKEKTPKASAVALFPAAARANRRFFYDTRNGSVDVATLHANLLKLCDDLLPLS